MKPDTLSCYCLLTASHLAKDATSSSATIFEPEAKRCSLSETEYSTLGSSDCSPESTTQVQYLQSGQTLLPHRAQDLDGFVTEVKAALDSHMLGERALKRVFSDAAEFNPTCAGIWAEFGVASGLNACCIPPHTGSLLSVSSECSVVHTRPECRRVCEPCSKISERPLQRQLSPSGARSSWLPVTHKIVVVQKKPTASLPLQYGFDTFTGLPERWVGPT